MKLCFLLERGTPPRTSPVIAEVFARLEMRGDRPVARYAEEEVWRLDDFSVDADLYVLKSDSELSLSLASGISARGGRVLNAIAACQRAKDKVIAAAVMAAAGVPAPPAWAAAQPGELGREAAAGPLILKPHRGYHGAGVTVADGPGELPDSARFPDLVLAQRFLGFSRRDLKVFAIGEEILGVRKGFSPDSYLRAGDPVPLDAEIERLARTCGDAFGLELYGLDVAETPDGPQVIDVNYFPGYRGVPDAARKLTDYLVGAARRDLAEVMP